MMTRMNRRRCRRSDSREARTGERVVVRWTGYQEHGEGEVEGEGGMMKNKANGQGDCLVSETLRELPIETISEIMHWLGNRFRGECWALVAWKVLWCCSRNQMRNSHRVAVDVGEVLRGEGGRFVAG